MDKSQAINAFWESFGLPVYDENSVPSGAPFPYLTYDLVLDDFGTEVAMSASLWYRSTSWKDITEKLNEIEKYIGRGGRTLAFDDGVIWIKKASPFAQRMGDTSDDKVKRMFLNVSAEYFSAD